MVEGSGTGCTVVKPPSVKTLMLEPTTAGAPLTVNRLKCSLSTSAIVRLRLLYTILESRSKKSTVLPLNVPDPSSRMVRVEPPFRLETPLPPAGSAALPGAEEPVQSDATPSCRYKKDSTLQEITPAYSNQLIETCGKNSFL